MLTLLTLTLFFITTAATAKQANEIAVAVPKVDGRDAEIVRLHSRLHLITHRWKVRGKVIHRLRRRLRERETRRGAAQPTSDSRSLPSSWLTAALCVHRGEGAWDANTGNGFYGGMQFDLGTWASVGGTGLPSNASVSEQLYRAYLLWQQRGWAPWPNTSRACGLR